jgi:AcrR family transcriptional regulator
MGGMGRWEPNARGRLQQAAFELFAERGFEQATVTEIAKRAGLTERTFYRHFADKPEVFFAGLDELSVSLLAAIAAAPDAAAPIEVVGAALETVTTDLQDHRGGARLRQGIIAANAELQERELIKLARTADAIADALRRRGVKDPTARLAAEAGIAVFRTAWGQWASDGADGADGAGDPSLPRLIRESLSALKAVTAGY